MHRFFFDSNNRRDDTVTLSKDESRHAAQVLRLKPGAEIILLDGVSHVYSACILSVEASHVAARITGALPGNEPKAKVTLYQGLPKADKMEWIVQKSTELGIHAIQPVLFSRCDRGIGSNSEKNVQRLQRIAREAAKQCGRGVVPAISFPVSFQKALPMICIHHQAIVAWEGEKKRRIVDVLAFDQALDIAIVIGPEGGIAPDEIDQLLSRGAHPITLGRRILRTETAGIVALASILTHSGEL